MCVQYITLLVVLFTPKKKKIPLLVSTIYTYTYTISTYINGDHINQIVLLRPDRKKGAKERFQEYNNNLQYSHLENLIVPDPELEVANEARHPIYYNPSNTYHKSQDHTRLRPSNVKTIGPHLYDMILWYAKHFCRVHPIPLCLS